MSPNLLQVDQLCISANKADEDHTALYTALGIGIPVALGLLGGGAYAASRYLGKKKKHRDLLLRNPGMLLEGREDTTDIEIDRSSREYLRSLLERYWFKRS